MFVWILLTGQTVAAVCLCACMCIKCVCCLCLCKRRKDRGKTEREGSLERCFQQRSVPEARPLRFAVVTTSKLCIKIATASRERCISQHR